MAFLVVFSVALQGRAVQAEAPLARQRLAMVQQQIEARGIQSPGVLAALRKVPRHEFIPWPYRHFAYEDHPVPIGEGQTISQPYIVALMTELLELRPDSKVLEIGTGSGYQAAILAELTRQVFSIEILPALAQKAKAALDRLGYTSVHVRVGDGYQGWPEAAPFDAILVTAAPADIPPPLIAQLKVGGRLVIPVGPAGQQDLLRVRKTTQGLQRERIIPVRFVPMTGDAQK
ncbi:MAG: protein-L-isoaspartate(D-aspartate) O-methyltransferase [Elusimicrobia bacterium]|nr:protein-L-isoaspartate(D-aspartate) O-methyltransferase [Elusimicrobiota bacterium]